MTEYTLDYFFDGQSPNFDRIKRTLLNEKLSRSEFLNLIPEIQSLHQLKGLERLTLAYFNGLNKAFSDHLSATYVAIASEDLYPRIEDAVKDIKKSFVPAIDVTEKEIDSQREKFLTPQSEIINEGLNGEQKELKWRPWYTVNPLPVHIKLIVYNPNYPFYRDNKEPLLPPDKLPSLD